MELPHKTPLHVKLLECIAARDYALGGQLVELLMQRVRQAATEGPWRHLQQGLQALCLLAAHGVVAKEELQSLLDLCEGSDYGRCLLAGCWGLDDHGPSGYRWKREVEAMAPLLPETFAPYPLGPLPTGLTPEAGWEPPVPLPLLSPSDHDGLFLGDRRSADLLLSNLRQLIETFDLNPKRLVEMLFAACGGDEQGEGLCVPDRLVWEVLLTELVRSRRPSVHLKQVCYEVIAMNCCRYRPRTFPPAMARRLQALLADDAQIVGLGPVGLTRLAEWFAHHLSNFDFKWKWEDWQPWLEDEGDASDALGSAGSVNAVSAAGLRRLFVVLLIERLARLSYGERLREVLPGWLQALLPDTEPEPLPQLANDARFAPLVESLGQRVPAEQVAAMLLAGGEATPEAAALLLEALVVAAGGKGSLTRCQSLLEAYLPCLQQLNPREREDCRLATLAAVAQVWQRSAWHRDWLLGRLLHYRVATAPQIIRWLLSTLLPTLTPLDQLQTWRPLAALLEQARTLPRLLERRLEQTEAGPAHDKLTASLQAMQREYASSVEEALTGLGEAHQPAFAQAIGEMHPLPA